MQSSVNMSGAISNNESYLLVTSGIGWVYLGFYRGYADVRGILGGKPFTLDSTWLYNAQFTVDAQNVIGTAAGDHFVNGVACQVRVTWRRLYDTEQSRVRYFVRVVAQRYQPGDTRGVWANYNMSSGTPTGPEVFDTQELEVVGNVSIVAGADAVIAPDA